MDDKVPFHEHLEFTAFSNRVKNLEDRLEAAEKALNNVLPTHKEALDEFQSLVAPLNNVDLYAIERQVLDTRVSLISFQALSQLTSHAAAVIVPLPPPPGLPDLTGYQKALGRQQEIFNCMEYVRTSLSRFRGEVKNSQTPLDDARKWYSEVRTHLRDRDMKDIMALEEGFPQFD